jgi:electron transport complex protein RnfD
MGIIPFIFILVYSVMVRLFAPFCYGGLFNTGDIILALLTSGTLFTATFMMQFPGTIPISISGKVLYAILAGILAFFICGVGTSPIGMSYTILICNVFNLILRHLEDIKLAEKQETL